MLIALRPSWSCASIHARCGSHADPDAETAEVVPAVVSVAVGGGTASGPPSNPGGRGGGISFAAVAEPVATPGVFAAAAYTPAYARIVLRSTPVRRAISRWLVPRASSVSIIWRR